MLVRTPGLTRQDWDAPPPPGSSRARLTPIASGESTVEYSLMLLLAAREASVSGSGALRDLIDDGRTR